MYCVKFVNCRPSKLAMESICVKGSANTDVFNHPSYNDCVILANSGFVECSKILLASRSQYFHQMFTRKENQEKICHVIILDSSFEAVKCAIDIMYGQKKTLNEKLKKRVQFLLTKFKVDYMIDGKCSEASDMSKPAKKPSSALSNEPSTAPRDDSVPIPAKQLRQEIHHEDSGAGTSQIRDSGGESISTECFYEKNSEMDWTMTSSDVDVDSIHHRIVNDHGRNKYKCCICGQNFNMIDFARKHYFDNHKDLKKSRNVLHDADFEKNIETAVSEIRKIVSSKTPCARNLKLELEDLKAQTTNIMEKVKSLTMDDLMGAPTLIRKKETTIESLKELLKEICSIYDFFVAN